ncbi:flagellar protein FlbB [Tardiphaga alba]|uniref:Flagellar protein FlbB n=1 Tax=Tardiphaga alba TaxID=340268 RepID=A0ABX8AEX3_9BRAD|nr:flagellar protein FlbB [Tardiphaga alba]QUS40968.1 flagellar protein FlbB [Tardiphaga alba]
MKAFRDIRILPVVLVAVLGLAILKIAGLVIDGGYVFEYQPQPVKASWAQEMFNFPGAPKPVETDITGSVPDKKADPAKPTVGAPDAIAVTNTRPVEQAPHVSDAERAILERLQSRRQELDARAREIEIRESLLKAAEKRIETRVDELKGVEAGIKTATEQKGEADSARFKGIVTMYESMKPKDAAKIFDRLEMPVLFEIASQIAPRKMSDILGLMQPEAAEKLTVELARRAQGGERTPSTAELPKIEGRPVQPVRN